MRLHVTTGDEVAKGQLLLELENPDLDLEIEKNRGELEATEKELDTLTDAALRSRGLTKDERLNLFARLDAAETKLANLKKQQAILKRKQEGLTITSPIDGRVATRNVEELLSDRPVSTSQVLLTVFDPDGDWELELNMPEKKVGHINGARPELAPGQKPEVLSAQEGGDVATRTDQEGQLLPR